MHVVAEYYNLESNMIQSLQREVENIRSHLPSRLLGLRSGGALGLEQLDDGRVARLQRHRQRQLARLVVLVLLAVAGKLRLRLVGVGAVL